MSDWMNHKPKSGIPGEVSIASDMQMTLMEESEEKLKNLLMKVKEEIEKAGLKLSIQKMNHGIWSTKVHIVKVMVLPAAMYGCEI